MVVEGLSVNVEEICEVVTAIVVIVGFQFKIHKNAKDQAENRVDALGTKLGDKLSEMQKQLEHLDSCIHRIDGRHAEMVDNTNATGRAIVDRMTEADAKIMDALNLVRSQVPPRSEVDMKVAEVRAEIRELRRDKG